MAFGQRYSTDWARGDTSHPWPPWSLAQRVQERQGGTPIDTLLALVVGGSILLAGYTLQLLGTLGGLGTPGGLETSMLESNPMCGFTTGGQVWGYDDG